MRITQNSMTRNYLSNLNKSMKNLADSNDRQASGRKFSRVSEDTSAASKAFSVREQLYKNEQATDNIKNAKDELSSVESNLNSINDVMQTVLERLQRGLTDTTSASGREVLAREITNLKDEMLQTINAKYGDKFIFAATNNNTPPLSVASDGSVMFNGTKVNNLVLDPTTQKPAVPTYDASVPPVITGYTPVAENKDIFLDVGLGLTLTGSNVDTRTAFNITVSGLDVLGYGTTEVDGVAMPNNLYSLLDKIASDLKNNDLTALGTDLTQAKARNDALVMNITDIGSRTNFLEQTLTRLGSDNLNLTAAQSNLELIKTE